MEKLIRTLLQHLLGFERYLQLVSRIYLHLVFNGFLKRKYPELFHLRELIKPGSICIDIGANVGYYSSFLSVYSGPEGHVYAVEPVALFASVFKKNTQRFGMGNITLYQTALGGSKGVVTMGTPVINGVLRHGLTSIVDPAHTDGMHTYQVPLDIPDQLFAGLPKVDFIKCDVEGYEVHLFPFLMGTLRRCKPTIQVEISTQDNRKQLMGWLMPLDYKVAKLSDGQLISMTTEEAVLYEGGDFYFLP